MSIRNSSIGAARIGTYAIAVSMALIFILPFLFMLSASFKSNSQIFADLESYRAFLPLGNLTTENYQRVFTGSGVVGFFVNSAIITVVTVGLGLLVNSMAGFALARLEWQGKNVALGLLVVLLIIPLEAIAVPMMLLVANLPWVGWDHTGLHITSSWLNTLHVQIFPFISKALYIFLFYQFFKGIPKDFDEAAYIDGASPFQVYWRVIIPLSYPVFATAAILHSLEMWNQYLWPVITVPSEDARPLMIGMQQFFRFQTDWGEVMAYATLITIPILIAFIIFQRQFVQSVMGSGVKG